MENTTRFMTRFRINPLMALLLIVLTIGVSACDDDVVGKWAPMEWKYENVGEGISVIKPGGADKDHAKYSVMIEVTQSGSIDVVCKNYGTFWFEDYPGMTYGDDSRTRFDTEFCEMKIEGNTLHCEFFDIGHHTPEEFQIVLTAGDIFYRLQIALR